MMGLRNEVIACLASTDRDVFLITLIHELTVSARGAYVQAGNASDAAACELRCYNELIHFLSGHLRDALLEAPRTENAVFVDGLIRRAQIDAPCDIGLRAAMQHALSQIVVQPVAGGAE